MFCQLRFVQQTITAMELDSRSLRTKVGVGHLLAAWVF